MHALIDPPSSVSSPAEPGWPGLDAVVAGVVDARRRAAAAQAAEARLLADAVGLVAERTALLRQEAQQRGGSVRASDADLPLREVALELAMALRVSDRGVQRRMSEAYLLTTLFPRTFEVWAGGEIDAAHAWAISRTGTLLTTEEDRGRYETLALEAARSESPARMTAAAKAIAATIDPTAFTEAAQRAYEERSVRLFPLEDGMARLIADLPAPLAHAIHDTLTARGRAILDQTDEDSDGEADVTSRPRTVIDDAGVRTTAAGGASDTRRGETLITSRAPATGPARPTDVTCTTTPTPTADPSPRFVSGEFTPSPDTPLTGTLDLVVTGTPGETVRLVVGGIERGRQVLNEDGRTTFSFSAVYREILHAPATIQYVDGERLGPEYTVFLWGPPPAP